MYCFYVFCLFARCGALRVLLLYCSSRIHGLIRWSQLDSHSLVICTRYARATRILVNRSCNAHVVSRSACVLLSNMCDYKFRPFRLPNVTYFRCYYFSFRILLIPVVRAFTFITNHTSQPNESRGTDNFVNPCRYSPALLLFTITFIFPCLLPLLSPTEAVSNQNKLKVIR